MKIFEPSGLSREVVRGLAKARKTNAERDEIDRSYGHATPSQCPINVQLRTVLSALFCGVGRKDWDCVYESIAMLQDLEVRFPDFLGGNAMELMPQDYKE